MKLAIVSIEDKRFAEHNGVDWPGTLTGLSGYLSGNLDARGGSTLEQQYVKNYQLLVTAQTDAERRAAVEITPARKLREIRIALTLDESSPKPRSSPATSTWCRSATARSVCRMPLRPTSASTPEAELAAGRAAGRHAEVDECARPVHQP